jgi:hypothetical protein
MAIKDYAVTQKRHYPGLFPDYEPWTTHQAFELHDGNKSKLLE